MEAKRMLGGERTSLTGGQIQTELISKSITSHAKMPSNATSKCLIV